MAVLGLLQMRGAVMESVVELFPDAEIIPFPDEDERRRRLVAKILAYVNHDPLDAVCYT
jgi:hypothetical protein